MADRVSENGDELCISTKVQLTGVLLKRPFGHQSNKWSKRFFVVKEGFLLYYPENEKKVFEKRGYFNIHPKGVIPLGGCSVDSVTDGAQQYAIHVKSEEFTNGCVALASENYYEREKWIQILQEASRITWKNTQLVEAMIRELEIQGLQLCRERQDYFDRLQEETMALRDEMDRNEELERVTAELDAEKTKLEKMMQELKEEHDLIKREFEETMVATKAVSEEKKQLQLTTTELQRTLQELAEEKERTLQALKDQKEENCKLFETKDELETTLKHIEEDTKAILEEKEDIEQRCRENELHSQVLAEEKKLISEHALNLQSSLQDLMTQKTIAEKELKAEIMARIDAEKQLKSAEESLHHLEKVIQTGGCHISDGIREEILPDVKRLKRFFEDVAEEAKIDADKPMIMKNAVLARKKLAQMIRSQRMQTNRMEKARSLGIVMDSPSENRGTLRRSLSTVLTDRSQVSSQRTLRRSLSTRQSSPKDGPVHCNGIVGEAGVTSASAEVVTINVDGSEVQVRRKLSVLGEHE